VWCEVAGADEKFGAGRSESQLPWSWLSNVNAVLGIIKNLFHQGKTCAVCKTSWFTIRSFEHIKCFFRIGFLHLPEYANNSFCFFLILSIRSRLKKNFFLTSIKWAFQSNIVNRWLQEITVFYLRLLWKGTLQAAQWFIIILLLQSALTRRLYLNIKVFFSTIQTHLSCSSEHTTLLFPAIVGKAGWGLYKNRVIRVHVTFDGSLDGLNVELSFMHLLSLFLRILLEFVLCWR